MVMRGPLHRFPNLSLEELRAVLRNNLVALLNSNEFTAGEKSLARALFTGVENQFWETLLRANDSEVAALYEWRHGYLRERFLSWGVDI